MKQTRIINFSLVIIYTLGLTLVASLVEAICFWAGAAPTDMMREMATPVAETGFSVTVIAVSILAVITSMSERRFFGIKAGEYLRFRHRPMTPGFYDNLIIIVLMGALQYVALGANAIFAAAALFIEIVALMIVEIRLGLGIAFFYYGRQKEIRSFFTAEMSENLDAVASGKSGSRRYERASLAVVSRIDNLFAHTKRAASLRESAEVEQNLGMLGSVLKMLLRPDLQRVWHNYETRLDSLVASLLEDDEHGQTALWALSHMTDTIMNTMDDPQTSKTVAQNCDFDRSREAAFDMVSYAETRTLRDMFEVQIFFKLVVVKVYGIIDDKRKVARYAHYTAQFAENAAAAQNKEDVRDFLHDSIVMLAPECFNGDKNTEAALYACLLIDAMAAHGIPLDGLRQSLEAKVHQCNDAKKQHSVYMLLRAMSKTLGMPQPLPAYTEDSRIAVENLQKLLASKPEQA